MVQVCLVWIRVVAGAFQAIVFEGLAPGRRSVLFQEAAAEGAVLFFPQVPRVHWILFLILGLNSDWIFWETVFLSGSLWEKKKIVSILLVSFLYCL
jgi:hypothetical protein